MIDSYRLNYHLMPPSGWLNDPNGLCQYKGTYHIFYQYSYDVTGGLKYWGHYTTKDFMNYVEEPVAIAPNSIWDKDGAYSGSAFCEDGTMHLFYTGNVKQEGTYDYILEGREQNIITLQTRDGVTFSDKECILNNNSFPSTMSCHVRDPKVVQVGAYYYMLLGARTKDANGCILVYQSKDLHEWNFLQNYKYTQQFGYMWECPDYIEVDGKSFLLFCPQGLETKNHQFQNQYQAGYCYVEGNLETGLTLTNFIEFDYGFDFYAPQTFVDDCGRTILIGWMGMPDAQYTNPSTDYNWQHTLTLPRQLTVRENKLYQYPIDEIQAACQPDTIIHLKKGHVVNYHSNSCRFMIGTNLQSFDLEIRNDIKLRYDGAIFELSLGTSGYGRKSRTVAIPDLRSLHIYSDISSMEIFINEGEYVLSTRLYEQEERKTLRSSVDLSISYAEIEPFQFQKNIMTRRDR